MFYEPGPILRPVNTRRVQILDAASELVAEQGFAQTSVDAVIARAVEHERSERRAEFDDEAVRHIDALYSFALKLARARDDADDLVSDTMLRAFQRWEQYRLGTNMRAWLFTILYHAFVSRKRRIDAREVQPLEDEDGREIFEAVGDADPESTFYDSFLDEDIVAAIQRLPDEYRDAVVMSDLHGLRYAEIAQVLGVPEGTIKSRLFRGRRLLQVQLRDYAEAMGYIKAGAATAAL